MKYRRGAALIVAMLMGSTTGRAQALQKDSVWNGVTTGAGVGAALGLVLAETTEDICSVPDCMALLAVAGSAVGLLVDKRLGHARAVEPGSVVDDRLRDGALLGAALGTTVVLIDFSRICRAPHGCTPEGVFAAAWRGALFSAALGALVDAAIPSRAADVNTTVRSRRPALAFSVRF